MTTYRASRLTAGNLLFPTSIAIDGDSIVRRKRSWLTVAEVRMHLSRVASVSIQTGLIWSDIRIESSGGGEDIVSHGHSKGDARAIRDAIEQWQSTNLRPERGERSGPTAGG